MFNAAGLPITLLDKVICQVGITHHRVSPVTRGTPRHLA
jgi:hypothetical protein